MKKLLVIVILGLFLSSCEMLGINDELRRMDGIANTYENFYYRNTKKWPYIVKAVSPSSGGWAAAASNISYAEASAKAIRLCNKRNNDCVLGTKGLQVIYSAPTEEDRKIAKAQSICRKVGYTQGTEAFADCTIKVLSHKQGQTVIVGYGGQRRTNIYPLHCRQMGGASAC